MSATTNPPPAAAVVAPAPAPAPAPAVAPLKKVGTASAPAAGAAAAATAAAQAKTSKVTEAMKRAWKEALAGLGPRERALFQSQTCESLDAYVAKIEAACEKHQDQSFALKVLDWFEPFFKSVELFVPAAAAAVQAYPNPGSLVLGGVIGVLSITSRLKSFQKLTLQMLSRMGRKLRVLQQYDEEIYQNEYPVVQTGLIAVYGDVIKFCLKAFRLLDENGELKAKVKGLKLILFRDFESALGVLVQKFEDDLEDLEAEASACDRKRLNEMRNRQAAQGRSIDDAVVLMRDHFKRSDDVHASLERREAEIREQEERRRQRRNKERLLEWLSPHTFTEPFDQRCREHLAGTGTWLLESTAYLDWKSQSSSDLLWVNGKPGCGKSVLAAVTIADLKPEMEADTALAYVFCRREESATQNATTILASLAKQISRQHPMMDPALEAEYRAFYRGEQPSQSTVRMVLRSCISHFTKSFLVIDALDECNENHDLADDILELLQAEKLPNVKIIVFSRHDYYLEESFNSYKSLQPDRGANDVDLQTFIYDSFPDAEQATAPRKNTNQEIRDECIKKANGMFLWVRLVNQSLKKSPLNTKQKLKIIQDIPRGLESVYDRVLSDIWAQDSVTRSIAFRVLIWIIHSKTPLASFAMLEAVADLEDANTLADAEPLRNPNLLVAMCANLVFIDKDGFFRLCHESVRDYLEGAATKTSEPLVEFQSLRTRADFLLAESCLNYLLLEDFQPGPVTSKKMLEEKTAAYPFLSYAATSWALHISNENEPSLRELILKFVRSAPRRELCMQVSILANEGDRETLWVFSDSTNVLHALALFGLRQTAECLPNVASLAQVFDHGGSTPLSHAIHSGNLEMGRWLIERMLSPGVYLNDMQKLLIVHVCAHCGWNDDLTRLLQEDRSLIDSQVDKYAETPLTRACFSGKPETVAIILSYGAEINFEDGLGETPLIAAVTSKQPDVVRLLLEKGADPNKRSPTGITPLHLTARNDDAKSAEYLLAHDANLFATAPNANDQTVLHFAVEYHAVDLIKALHRAHPKLDIKTREHYTALHIAAYYNSSKSAKELLALGVPKNDIDDYGNTAIMMAANKGHLETIEVLAAAGCDVSVKGKKGGTALHSAAITGKLVAVRHILQCVPSKDWKRFLNQRNHIGETVLHHATENGNFELVQYLLETGADVTITGFNDWNALHYAAYYGQKSLARLILSYSKQPNPPDRDNDTPLHLATRAGKLDFIKQLYEDCSKLGLTLDLTLGNDSKANPFLVSLEEGHRAVIDFLMERSPPMTPTRRGNYPIHLAAWHGFTPIVREFLEQEGANTKGYLERTPMVSAVIRGHLEIVKMLAERFETMKNEPEETGSTPLLIALRTRNIEVANYLLDINADHLTLNKIGEGPLHIAAALGEVAVTKRLLELGCRGDLADLHGTTPFQRAVESDSLEILEALMEKGVNCVDVPNAYGSNTLMSAAANGNQAMFEQLAKIATQLDYTDFLGRSIAYYAAQGGHVSVLRYLREHGVRLDEPDLEGETPFMLACSKGYVHAARYLLHTQSTSVNAVAKWDPSSALTDAVRHRRMDVVKILLDAGADPLYRDSMGLNSLDYAAAHQPLLRMMHKAQHFQDAEDLQAQSQILCCTIRRSCEKILELPSQLTVPQLYMRLARLISLLKALLRVGDDEAAKLCAMEIYWPRDEDHLNANYRCDFCRWANFWGDKHICVTCYGTRDLCNACHTDHKDGGKKVPEAISEVRALEAMLMRVRQHFATGHSLASVTLTMYYYKPGPSWISETTEKYEAWEEKYKSRTVVKNMPRPGQEFLKLVRSAYNILRNLQVQGGVDEEEWEQLTQLNEKYAQLQRKHRLDKNVIAHDHADHQFFRVAAKDYTDAKASGRDIDPQTGRVRNSLFEGLLKKYSPGSQAKPLRGLKSWEPVESKPPVPAAPLQSDLFQPRPLKKSFTSFSPPGTGLSRDDMSVPTKSTAEAKRSPPGSAGFGAPRRAHTLYIPSDSAKESNPPNDANKDKASSLRAAVHAHLHSESDAPELRPHSPPRELGPASRYQGILDAFMWFHQLKPNVEALPIDRQAVDNRRASPSLAADFLKVIVPDSGSNFQYQQSAEYLRLFDPFSASQDSLTLAESVTSLSSTEPDASQNDPDCEAQ